MAETSDKTPQRIDLQHLAQAAAANGPAWSHTSADLNVNLVVMHAPGGVPEHTNNEVDVVFVGVDGTGILTIDGNASELRAGTLIVVPKGTNRGLTVRDGQCAYVTCHQRRAGLWPHGIRPE